MSIATEITRIQSDRDQLRTKALELKLSTKADVDTVSKAITNTSNLMILLLHLILLRIREVYQPVLKRAKLTPFRRATMMALVQ